MQYDNIDLNRGKRGRPATGRTTIVCRVPIDTNVPLMIRMYHKWLPILEEYRSIAQENPQAVRNEKLVKLLEELGSW